MTNQMSPASTSTNVIPVMIRIATYMRSIAGANVDAWGGSHQFMTGPPYRCPARLRYHHVVELHVDHRDLAVRAVREADERVAEYLGVGQVDHGVAGASSPRRGWASWCRRTAAGWPRRVSRCSPPNSGRTRSR